MQQAQRRVMVGPSILSADFAFLFRECQEMLEAGAQTLHIDIMDGHFVPNLTIGAPVVASLRKHLPLAHFDCHLMVAHPRHYVQPLATAGADCFTFHYEAHHDGLRDLCASIRSHKMEVGLSVKPKTAIDAAIEELIAEKLVDKVLVMTVEPGFGGQKFMPETMGKVEYLHAKYPHLEIQVDGGIGIENAELVAKSGANWLVAGSALFNAPDRRAAFQAISSGARRGLGLE